MAKITRRRAGMIKTWALAKTAATGGSLFRRLAWKKQGNAVLKTLNQAFVGEERNIGRIAEPKTGGWRYQIIAHRYENLCSGHLNHCSMIR